MSEAKATNIPADPHVTCPSESNKENSAKIPRGSRVIDISRSRIETGHCVLRKLCKQICNHNENHWQSVKRIFRYLIGTTNIGIKYTNGGRAFELIGFSDSNFASDIEIRRSITGYAFCIADGLVSWSFQRQKLVMLSTTEAEYVAAATAAKEAI